MVEVSAPAKPSKTQRTADDKPNGALHYLGMGISAGLFGLVLLVGALVIVIPTVAGAMPLTVLTSSMEPGLPPGTLIVVKPIETNAIAMGDVITYQIESGKPGVITHRVTGITNSSDGDRTFTLKGDNNDVADELQVLPVQVVGKLWYSVPWIGNVSNYVNGNGQSWLVPVIAISLFVYAGFMIMSGVVSSVRKRKQERVEAEHEAELAAFVEAAPVVVAAEPAVNPTRKPAQKSTATPTNKAARKR
ncbi:signal peptidase I [Rhodoglobus aureus]|uniref:Signal peptidase I n=1 Tax=Rhodoglobus aureus TaxID=191497 RepID=A0ABP4FYV6_9MICO